MAPEPAPPQAPPAEVAPPPPVPTAVTVPPPAPAPPPAPRPSLVDLGVERLVQPQWAGEGDRILFYDQPQPGMGGTWAIDPVTGQRSRERPQWGSYVARGTLLVTPRPAQRDTYVLHVPSGREWALPTTSGTLFSPDGTVVAYTAPPPARRAPGGGGGPNTFQTTTLTVSGADGQGARRLPLPLNASPVAFLPGGRRHPQRPPPPLRAPQPRRTGPPCGCWTSATGPWSTWPAPGAWWGCSPRRTGPGWPTWPCGTPTPPRTASG